MLKEILLTHNDMDGAGCRIIFEVAHANCAKGYDYDVVNCANGSIDEDTMNAIARSDVDTNTEIFFADICAHEPVLKDLIDKGYKIKIFDHHQTNVPLLELNPSWVIKVKNDLGQMYCGTSLLYQYYSQTALIFPSDNRLVYFRSAGNDRLLAELVENIRLYDTWEWKRNNIILPKDLHTLYFLLGMDNFCYRFISRIQDKGSGGNLILNTDWEFINAKTDYESKVIKSFSPDKVLNIDVRGLKTAMTLGTKGASASEVAYNFLKNNPEYDLFINYTLSPKPSYFSLRTIRTNLDIGTDVAQPIGGGGHEQAAGVPLRSEVQDEIIDILVKELNRGYEPTTTQE